MTRSVVIHYHIFKNLKQRNQTRPTMVEHQFAVVG